jgi:UDP-2,3-diacylglucosamine hydrolase
MDRAVYFASDSHFGAGSEEDQKRRVRRFVAWLESLEDASHLYLLGDIFDFWLDYPNFMPKNHLEVLYALRNLRERGVQLYFVGGNHDVWCAHFLQDSLGIETLENGAVIEHQGRRLRLDHGDGLLGGDRFYALYRSIVRHPWVILTAKSVHPELLQRLASVISRHSRGRDRASREEVVALIENYGTSHTHDDVDHLVVGHVHCPYQRRFGSWTFTCLGDWIVHFTAGRLLGGELSLIRAPEPPQPRP